MVIVFSVVTTKVPSDTPKSSAGNSLSHILCLIPGSTLLIRCKNSSFAVTTNMSHNLAGAITTGSCLIAH